MRWEGQERFSRKRGLTIPTCITARASRSCRDTCRDRYLAVCFDSMAGRRPGIPGACATHSFTYLVRGPWGIQHNPMYTSTPSRGALSCLVRGCFNHPFKSITLFGHLGLAEIFLITHFVIFISVSFIRNFMGCDIFSISWLKMKLSKT